MDIHLIRHPKTVVTGGTCYGASDIEANPVHLAQDIARNARALPADARFISSTQQRAMALARGLAGDRPVTTDSRLVEMDFGDWENRQWADLPRAEIDAWAADTGGYTPPNGESVNAMAARVLDWWTDVTIEETPLVVISHGGPLRILAAHVTGSTPDRSMAFEIKWGNRALIWHNAHRTVLAGWNLR